VKLTSKENFTENGAAAKSQKKLKAAVNGSNGLSKKKKKYEP